MVKKYLIIACILLVSVTSGAFLFGAGTDEVTARDLQENEIYAALDLPYSAEISLSKRSLDHTFDFKTRREIPFTYYEYLETKDTDPMIGLEKFSSEENRGTMNFVATGLGFADIIYPDLESTVKKTYTDLESGMNLEERSAKDTKTIRHKGLTDSGEFIINEDLNFSYHLQFPITDGTLTMGQASRFDTLLPLHVAGSILNVPGGLEVMYVGNVPIRGKVYAKLLTKIAFNDTGLPEGTGELFGISAEGYGVYYYDIEDKIFYYGNLTLDISVEAASLTPNLSKFQESTETGLKRILETHVEMKYQKKAAR